MYAEIPYLMAIKQEQLKCLSVEPTDANYRGNVHGESNEMD